MLELQGAVSYLAERGINEEDTDRLGLEIKHGSSYFPSESRLAIHIHCYDMDHEELDWYAVRFVGQPSGLLAQTDQSTLRKAICKAGVPIRGYLPRILDWRGIPEDSRIYICESAIKAANLALMGYYAIGLNGVRGWSSMKYRRPLIPELADMPWSDLRLQPYILFDSDTADNQQVRNAVNGLAARLYSTFNIQSRQIILPQQEDGSNQGIDDYIREHRGAARELIDGEGVNIAGDPVQMGIARLNEEVVDVLEHSRIYHLYYPDALPMTASVFKTHAFADRTTPGENRAISIADAWLKSTDRHRVQRLDYVPGGDHPTGEDKRGSYLNQWRGLGVEPNNEGADNLLGFVHYLIPDREQANWLLDVLAWPLQNLGEKLMVCPVLVGKQGIGKSMLGVLMKRVYGDLNSKVITKEEFASSFNSLWATRQFVILDEMGQIRGKGKTIMDMLKKSISEETININRKGQPEYTIQNHINFFATTNSLDALTLGHDDRRFGVLDCRPIEDHVNDQAYWDMVYSWTQEDAGAWLGFLLERDLGGFKPKGWAIATEAKEEMKEATRTPTEQFAVDLYDNWEDWAKDNKGRVLWTVRDLIMVWSLVPGRNIDYIDSFERSLGKHMTELGIPRLKQMSVDGVKTRFRDISRRKEPWTNDEIREHLVKTMPKTKYD